MTLYITGPSALEYWRRSHPSSRRRTRAALPFGSGQSAGASEFKVSDLAAISDAGLDWLSEPVHLLVPKASSRRRCARASFHVCSQPMPEGSFSRVSRDVMVASPELSCVACASSRCFPLLVELLYEMCGHYRLPNGRTGDFIEMPPATSVDSLVSFVERAKDVGGTKKMRQALRYVCDNSLSPMETDVAEALVLDTRMGGFGVVKPQLNPRFDVAGKNRRMLPQSSYVPDLYWPSANLSVEYESNRHHSREGKLTRDAIRRNGIEHLGTRVITLTWSQASNYYEFERVALMVAHATGKRFSNGWDKWAKRRMELHRLLVHR